MTTSQEHSGARRALILFALVAAGEAAFLLPFVVARVFRPTLLDVFGIDNFALGTAFSLYGIVAMVSYFFGGPLADRFPARLLMAVALVATAMGGVLLAQIPSIQELRWLFAFWGLTTILLFWAALIRATREWGGASAQGRAYGLLDGGRGLFAAVLASASVFVFARLLGVDADVATLEQRATALSGIIWVFTILTGLIAVLVWLAVPTPSTSKPERPRLTLAGIRDVLRLPPIWFQAGIVVCAYVGYKSTDDFSLLARDTLGYNDVEAASLGSVSFWVRPFAAIAAGLLGDWIGNSRATLLAFSLQALGALALASGVVQPGMGWLLFAIVIGTGIGIYALRGIYFALFEEAKIPMTVMGSAVGIVSVVGYTPDVFMGPLMGYLLDRTPGPVGHQHVFLAVAMFSAVGLLCTLAFRRATRTSAPSFRRA